MHETILRTIFIIHIIGVLGASGWFRGRANRAKDKLDRKKEGALILILRSIFGVFILGYILSYILAPGLVQWSLLSFPLWLRYTGAALSLVISLLVLWMFISLGKNITDTVDTRKEATLVTTGIYKYVRHPLYTLGSLFHASLGMLTGSWVFFLFSISAFIVIGVFRTRREEEQLIAKFGQEYIDYQQKTGKYFPKIFG